MIRYQKHLLLLNYSLRPVMMNNTCPLRITATAGTKLVGASSLVKVIILTSDRTLRPIFKRKSFLLSSFTQHYWIKLSLIVQDSPLLAKSPGLISVPVWLYILSDQLGIIGLVSFYLTNNLIPHELIKK